MSESRYCRECGCEILCDGDVGFEEVELNSASKFRGHPEHGLDIFKRPFVVCRSCTEEVEREWEAFTRTPEFEYECAFNRWVREFSDEAKQATI